MTSTSASGTAERIRSRISEMFAASLWVGTMINVRTSRARYCLRRTPPGMIALTQTAATASQTRGEVHPNRLGQSGPGG